MNRFSVLAILAILLLSGCGTTSTKTIVETLGANGEIVNRTITTIADQSTHKEQLYTDNIKALIDAHSKDALKPLVEIKTEQVTKTATVTLNINGQVTTGTTSWTETVIVSASARAPMRFDYDVPWRPSRHPAWNTIYDLAKLGLIGFGIDKFIGWQEGISSRPTYQFEGTTFNSPFTMDGSSSWVDSSGYTFNELIQ